MKIRNVLVTGGAGYIGSVLVRQLLAYGWFVTVLDRLSFGGESLLEVVGHPHFRFIRGDIRDKQAVREALTGVDSVVHLAAVVGDPACEADPTEAIAINRDATLSLYEAATAAGAVERFIFASTCSNYGRMSGTSFVDEESPLAPLSVYARTKVEVERVLLAEDTPGRPVTAVLRFATAYGLSSRVRFDLTVNDFVRDAVYKGKLVVFGEQFWRPYCHVSDLARACTAALLEEPAKVHRQVFGVGDTRENYRKEMIVEEIRRVVPQLVVEHAHRDEDPRDYRVSFAKIRRVLSFSITKRVPDGIVELHKLLRQGLLSNPFDRRYQNI